MMSYFDAHVHLQESRNIQNVLREAKSKKIFGFICNAKNEKEWQTVMDLSRLDQGIKACVGIHPKAAVTVEPGFERRLEKLLSCNPELMVGETGLESAYAQSVQEFEIQKLVFRKQLEIAYHFHRPIHIHCGKNDIREMMSVLRTSLKPDHFVMHSHHGNPDLIPELISMGAYLSYSPLTLLDGCVKMRACLAATPSSRLLAESDAPYLSEAPMCLPELVHHMAFVRKENEQDLSEKLVRNVQTLLTSYEGGLERYLGRNTGPVVHMPGQSKIHI